MSSWLRLRLLVSDAHAWALAATGLLDRDVEDLLFEERMHRIRTQLTAALALGLSLIHI